MLTCSAAIREEVDRRFENLGIQAFFVPQNSTAKPDEPHVKILTTPPDILATRKRVIILVNDEAQDLGVLSHRVVAGDGGIERGTCVAFIKELMDRSKAAHDGKRQLNWAETVESRKCDSPTGNDDSLPGLVILNPGQLLYSHELKCSMTRISWISRPRPSAVHSDHAMDQQFNYVLGNKTPGEHVDCALRWVVEATSPHVKFYLVGMQTRQDVLLQRLDKHWGTGKGVSNISAIALMDPRGTDAASLGDPRFKDFLSKRARGWVPSPAPALAVVDVPPQSLQPNFSAGSCTAGEYVFTELYQSVLDWFEEVVIAEDNYENPVFTDVWKEPDPFEEKETVEEAVMNETPVSPPVRGAFDGLDLNDVAEASANLLGAFAAGMMSTAGREEVEVPAVGSGTVEEVQVDEDNKAGAAAWPKEEEVTVAGEKLPKSLVEKAGLGNLAS